MKIKKPWTPIVTYTFHSLSLSKNVIVANPTKNPKVWLAENIFPVADPSF